MTDSLRTLAEALIRWCLPRKGVGQLALAYSQPHPSLPYHFRYVEKWPPRKWEVVSTQLSKAGVIHSEKSSKVADRIIPIHHIIRGSLLSFCAMSHCVDKGLYLCFGLKNWKRCSGRNRITPSFPRARPNPRTKTRLNRRWLFQWALPGLLAAVVLVALAITQIKSPKDRQTIPESGKPACPQYPALKPPTSEREKLEREVREEINSEDFFNKSWEKMQGAVRIKTESFDDMGKVGEDARWDVFADFQQYLKETFPRVYVLSPECECAQADWDWRIGSRRLNLLLSTRTASCSNGRGRTNPSNHTCSWDIKTLFLCRR